MRGGAAGRSSVAPTCMSQGGENETTTVNVNWNAISTLHLALTLFTPNPHTAHHPFVGTKPRHSSSATRSAHPVYSGPSVFRTQEFEGYHYKWFRNTIASVAPHTVTPLALYMFNQQHPSHPSLGHSLPQTHPHLSLIPLTLTSFPHSPHPCDSLFPARAQPCT